MKRQEVKLKSHDQAMPQAPGGAFAGFKQATYEQAVTKWRGIRVGLEKRFQQIKNRLGLIGDYMRQSGSHGVVSKAERLAEQKAARAKPELAKTFAQIVEQEKAVAIAQRREQIQQRLTGKPQEKAMDQQTIDHLKSVSDANREKAERAELKELEKAGRLAAIQSDFNAEQKVDLNQITKQQGDAIAKELNADNDKGDQTKAARKIELLDRFKEKASRDRDDNSRGR
jgi:vacuolar-type H+-ATPase subunit I/STV1